VNEVDLDRELEEQQRRDNGELVSDEESSDNVSDDEDWEKPSAYSLLMGSLKKTSKNQTFYKKIQLEQEGLEETAATDSDEDDDDDDDMDAELEMDEESGKDQGKLMMK
jgi:U3 small nucleolar RNA-associated protein 25